MKKVIRLTESELVNLIKSNLYEQTKSAEETGLSITQIMELIKKNPEFLKEFETCIKELKIKFNPNQFVSVLPPNDVKAREWFDKMNEDIKKIMDCIKRKRPDLYKKLKIK